MKWQAIIAGIALVVSIGTAIFSYSADQRSQHRQRLFEVTMVKMQSVELAKRDISRISSQLNRILNAMVLNVGDEPGTVYIQGILDSYGAAVDVFNAVKHNLNEADAQAFHAKITEYETSLFDTLEDGGAPTPDQLTALTAIPGNLETMIDKVIEELQTEMAKD